MARERAIVRLSSKGQLVIPAGLRRQLGLRAGQTLALRRGADREIVITPAEAGSETLEAALTLVSHALLTLGVPLSRVIRTVGDIRHERYRMLRTVFRREAAELIDESHTLREELHTVVLPPGAWSVGRTLSEVRERGAEVSFTAIRRDGIVGRDPDPETKLREGDVVVLFGTPEAQEHAEAVLLAG